MSVFTDYAPVSAGQNACKPLLTLRPGTRSDLSSCATVLSAAFLDFEAYDHFLTDRRTQYGQYRRFLLARLRTFYSNPLYRFVVAEIPTNHVNKSSNRCAEAVPVTTSEQCMSPETREIVAFAVWEARGAQNPLVNDWYSEGFDAGGGNGRNFFSFLASGISTAVEPYLLKIESEYTRLFLNTVCDYVTLMHIGKLLRHNFDAFAACLHLQLLVTHPMHQGNGAGRLLLHWGLDLARTKCLPVVLESSLSGRKFYEQKGFKTYALVRIGEWIETEEVVQSGARTKIAEVVSGAKVFDMPVMVSEPESQEEEWFEPDGNDRWRLRDELKGLHISENRSRKLR